MISGFVQLIGVPNVVCPKGHIRWFRNLVVRNNWVRCIVIHPFILIWVTKKEALDGFLRLHPYDAYRGWNFRSSSYSGVTKHAHGAHAHFHHHSHSEYVHDESPFLGWYWGHYTPCVVACQRAIVFSVSCTEIGNTFSDLNENWIAATYHIASHRKFSLL